MLSRARLHEYYRRIVREDMLTMFSRTVEIDSLECSVVLPGTVSDENKYRAACILEIVTGQRAHGAECKVSYEDPLFKPVSEARQRELGKIRGAALRQSAQRGAKKGAAVQLAADDFRKIGSGFKLRTVLSRLPLYDFLEKCREFYLPDVLSIENREQKEMRPPERGHDNTLERKLLLRSFQKWTMSKLTVYPPRHPLGRTENVDEALTTYVVRATELLKFPDIELHFEAMGRALSGGDGADEGAGVQLILRPTLKIECPVRAEQRHLLPLVDNVKMMNHLLSIFFNPYMHRPRIVQHSVER